jgi:tetratricopeptide (TPR) repeat protein
MPAPIRRYDELGFPIASTFEDLSKGEVPVRPGGPSRAKRRIMIVLVLVVAALAAAPWAKTAGRAMLASWWAKQAQEKFRARDFTGTVEDSTRALDIKGEDPVSRDHALLLFMRADARLELNDVEGSVRDFDRLVQAKFKDPDLMPLVYYKRAWANCRAGRHRVAIDDATQAIKHVGRESPELLNLRAYIRALGNVDRKELEAGLDDVERAMGMSRRNAAFIDTRGYLHHLLGNQDKALQDLNDAISMTMSDQSQVRRARALPEMEGKLNEDLAVMYHHRSLVHQALGNIKEAEADRELAAQLGYNPDAGIL